MKIVEVNYEEVVFDNGSTIWYDHSQSCCEENYADFKQIEDAAMNWEFDEDLQFEMVEDYGFRFGSGGRMFFIPCYSQQNGFYSTNLNIYYNGQCVGDLHAELIEC